MSRGLEPTHVIVDEAAHWHDTEILPAPALTLAQLEAWMDRVREDHGNPPEDPA